MEERRPPQEHVARVALAGMLGVLGEVLEGRKQHRDEIPYEVDADGEPEEEEAFELYLNPDIPAASLALVRPRNLRR